VPSLTWIDLNFEPALLKKKLLFPKRATFLCLSAYLCPAAQQALPTMGFSYFQRNGNESGVHVPLLHFPAIPGHSSMTPS
jgi:hypothetical protein